MIHFGTAGWLYKDWEGIVYPKEKPLDFDPLHFLARFFSTVEINSTYYGPATQKTADKWIARVSDFPDFRFTAKLWKRFTHDRGTAWTRAEVKEARGAFDRMLSERGIGFVNIDQPLFHNSIKPGARVSCRRDIRRHEQSLQGKSRG
jgi:uncharacterized protein YecE (DUF72 family)